MTCVFMCWLAVYFDFNANAFHLHLSRTQAVSLFEFADFLSCRVPSVFPAAAAWPHFAPDHIWSHQRGPKFVVQWGRFNTKILVFECLLLTFCLRFPHTPRTLSQHDSWSVQKTCFRAKLSKFVLFVVPRSLQKHIHHLLSKFAFTLDVSSLSTQPVPVPTHLSRHARLFLFACVPQGKL